MARALRLGNSNPIWNEKVIRKYGQDAYGAERADAMTISSTITKIGMLLVLTVAAAGLSWTMLGRNPSLAPAIFGVGLIGGLIFALISSFSPRSCHITGPLYALFEGALLGGLTMLINAAYPGIAIQAVALTFGVFLLMLVLYSTRTLRATPAFVKGITACIGAIFLIYVVSFVMRLFGATFPYIHDAGLIGIGFSLFVVGIAALSLVLDFHLIETGAEQGMPKYMEWYAAFGLLVTLIWLYVEILILLSKLNRR